MAGNIDSTEQRNHLVLRAEMIVFSQNQLLDTTLRVETLVDEVRSNNIQVGGAYLWGTPSLTNASDARIGLDKN